MSDDLMKRLRNPNGPFNWEEAVANQCEAADRIEKLNEDVGVLIAASIRLSSRIDLDSDGYVDRIEKLEAALRFIAGPSTVEFVDGTYEISETKMLSTYRRRAKRALEGNYDD